MNDADVRMQFEGKVLQGRYRLRRMLSRGAFGMVFQADHEVLGRTVRHVAVKVSQKTQLTAGDLQETFAEAIVTARIYDSVEGTPAARYLIPIYDMGVLPELDGRGFVVMGLVRGVGSSASQWAPPETLERMIRNWPSGMPWQTAVEYMKRLARAVGALHEQAVVHRDLKPDNVLISDTGELRLIDLGLAAALGPDGVVRGAAGTYSYMAPETGLEERSSCASDVYAMGIIFYEMLTSQMPWRLVCPDELKGNDEAAWVQGEKVNAPILPPSDRSGVHEAPKWLDALVLRCLSSFPEARPPDANALLQCLAGGGRSEGGGIYTGVGWNEWFGDDNRDWEAARKTCESFLGSRPDAQKDAAWFEAATKLGVAMLHDRAAPATDGMTWLRDARELLIDGRIPLGYEEQVLWYEGILRVLERTQREKRLVREFQGYADCARAGIRS